MKTIICVLLGFFLFALQAKTQTIELEHLTIHEQGYIEHNFDTIPDNVIASWQLKLKNTGTETLVIQDITTSCDCTQLTTTSKKIAPNESAWLEIRLNTKGKYDKISTFGQLTTNAKNHANVWIKLDAFVASQHSKQSYPKLNYSNLKE